jgi:hypothetical protein
VTASNQDRVICNTGERLEAVADVPDLCTTPFGIRQMDERSLRGVGDADRIGLVPDSWLFA